MVGTNASQPQGAFNAPGASIPAPVVNIARGSSNSGNGVSAWCGDTIDYLDSLRVSLPIFWSAMDDPANEVWLELAVSSKRYYPVLGRKRHRFTFPDDPVVLNAGSRFGGGSYQGYANFTGERRSKWLMAGADRGDLIGRFRSEDWFAIRYVAVAIDAVSAAFYTGPTFSAHNPDERLSPAQHDPARNVPRYTGLVPMYGAFCFSMRDPDSSDARDRVRGPLSRIFRVSACLPQGGFPVWPDGEFAVGANSNAIRHSLV